MYQRTPEGLIVPCAGQLLASQSRYQGTLCPWNSLQQHVSKLKQGARFQLSIYERTLRILRYTDSLGKAYRFERGFSP